MFSSQANGSASAAGFAAKTILDVGQIDSPRTHFVVIDLSIPSLDIASIAQELKRNHAMIIAVGPHVHEAKLALAQQSGCDVVLTKGQAARELGDVLQKLAAENNPE